MAKKGTAEGSWTAPRESIGKLCDIAVGPICKCPPGEIRWVYDIHSSVAFDCVKEFKWPR